MALLERLRERYRPDADRDESVPGYVEARRFDGLVPDPAWLPTWRVPSPDLMRGRVEQWLRDHGAVEDLGAPSTLPPVAVLRDRNAERLEALVAQMTPVVLAWCRVRGTEPPPGWLGTPLVESKFALEATGLADLIDVPDDVLLRTVATGAGWPDGMELATDVTALGLSDADVAPPNGGGPTGRNQPLRTIHIGDAELPVGGNNLARIAEAALQTIDQAFASQSGKTHLGDIATAPGGRSSAAGVRGGLPTPAHEPCPRTNAPLSDSLARLPLGRG